jgi:hypothetical protein
MQTIASGALFSGSALRRISQKFQWVALRGVICVGGGRLASGADIFRRARASERLAREQKSNLPPGVWRAERAGQAPHCDRNDSIK